MKAGLSVQRCYRTIAVADSLCIGAEPDWFLNQIIGFSVTDSFWKGSYCPTGKCLSFLEYILSTLLVVTLADKITLHKFMRGSISHWYEWCVPGSFLNMVLLKKWNEIKCCKGLRMLIFYPRLIPIKAHILFCVSSEHFKGWAWLPALRVYSILTGEQSPASDNHSESSR